MLRALLATALVAAGCAPPSLRGAHSMDKGAVAFEASAYGSMSTASATALAPEADIPVEGRDLDGFQNADLGLRFGLGAGFEIGVGLYPTFGRADLKYSILDERRHKVPLSLAIDLQGTWDGIEAGLLASRTFELEGGIGIRPIVNAWYGSASTRYRLHLEGEATGRADQQEDDVLVRADTDGIFLAFGAELPVRTGTSPKGRERAVVPYIGFMPLLQLKTGIRSVRCGDCLIGLSDFEEGMASFFWFGLRFEPWLKPAPEAKP